MFKRIWVTLTAVLMFGGISLSAQAAILNVNGDGLLTGAQNVNLGSLGVFDVEFVDTSCRIAFTGCESAADDFDFQNAADALVAAQALLDQVLINSTSGQFDDDPSLTFGCTGSDLCAVLIPYEVVASPTGITLSSADNFSLGFIIEDVAVETVGISAFLDLSVPPNDRDVFAVFTASASVPEPSVALLFGFGLLGLIGVKARRGKAASA